MKSRQEAAGSQQHRAFREDRASVIDPLKVVFSDGGHADGTRGTIQKLVAISAKNRDAMISKHAADLYKHSKKRGEHADSTRARPKPKSNPELPPKQCSSTPP